MFKRSFQPRLASMGYIDEVTCRHFSVPWLAESAGLLHRLQSPSEFLLFHEEILKHCRIRHLWVNNHRTILSDRRAGFPLNAMAPPFLRSFKKICFDRQGKNSFR